MAKWDLTNVLAPYLDCHLVFPLLEFLSGQNIYDPNDVQKAKLELINRTNMLDYSIDIFKSLHDGEVPESLKVRKQEVVDQLKRLLKEAGPTLSVLQHDTVWESIAQQRDTKGLLASLQNEHDFNIDMEKVYQLAKCQYDCGNYSLATSNMYFYLLLMPPSDKNYLNVLWGKLAAEILTRSWETALDDLTKLKEYIESSTFSNSLQSLQQRSWLMHWSLFIFFNLEKGRDTMIDMFLYRPNYLNAIQTTCPHLLRYLAATVIMTRSRRSALRDLVKVIQQESYTYRDPITEFLEHLYIKFDFEGARAKLHECCDVVANDFFLVFFQDEFVHNARLMIFETFCRIHHCISIDMLSDKLNMQRSGAEHWIVNLVRSARLDAKIDSKLSHIVMGTQPLSPYQQLLEKVDSLSVKSEALFALLERKAKQRSADNRWGQHEYANA